jgi:hypothetical protein
MTAAFANHLIHTRQPVINQPRIIIRPEVIKLAGLRSVLPMYTPQHLAPVQTAALCCPLWQFVPVRAGFELAPANSKSMCLNSQACALACSPNAFRRHHLPAAAALRLLTVVKRAPC